MQTIRGVVLVRLVVNHWFIDLVVFIIGVRRTARQWYVLSVDVYVVHRLTLLMTLDVFLCLSTLHSILYNALYTALYTRHVWLHGFHVGIMCVPLCVCRLPHHWLDVPVVLAPFLDQALYRMEFGLHLECLCLGLDVSVVRKVTPVVYSCIVFSFSFFLLHSLLISLDLFRLSTTGTSMIWCPMNCVLPRRKSSLNLYWRSLLRCIWRQCWNNWTTTEDEGWGEEMADDLQGGLCWKHRFFSFTWHQCRIVGIVDQYQCTCTTCMKMYLCI